MSPTLREQLASIPLMRSTTILRTDLPLPPDSASLIEVRSLVAAWCAEKTTPYGQTPDASTSDLRFAQAGFSLDYASDRDEFSLLLEEPDAIVRDRTWVVACALRREADRAVFGLRLSFKQPQNVQHRPDPRAPRFLGNLLNAVHVVDVMQVQAKAQFITSQTVPFLQDLLRARQRSLPVIAISGSLTTGEPLVDVPSLTQVLAGTCHVFILDPSASWELTREWRQEWSVFGGAVRCYNAAPEGLLASNPFDHRLWTPQTIDRLNAAHRKGFLNGLATHVFAQTTAQFEVQPLLSPDSLRRSRAEALAAAAPPEPKPPIEVQASAPAAPEPVVVVEDTARLTELEGQIVALESTLQQERTGRADTERRLNETELLLTLFQDEARELTQKQDLMLGRSDSSTPASLRPLLQGLSDVFQATHTLIERTTRLEGDVAQTELLEQEVKDLRQEVAGLRVKAEIRERYQPQTVGVDYTKLAPLLPKIGGKNPPLGAILDLVAEVFPDRITVLPSARKSAEVSTHFTRGEQAFDLFWKLTTDYWETVRTKGDTEAKKLFGQSYAATESDSLSLPGRQRRTFRYKDTDLFMGTHLRIGTADNKSDTLRIHFAWLGDAQRIVIGHCGKHLDF